MVLERLLAMALEMALEVQLKLLLVVMPLAPRVESSGEIYEGILVCVL